MIAEIFPHDGIVPSSTPIKIIVSVDPKNSVDSKTSHEFKAGKIDLYSSSKKKYFTFEKISQ
jgi:hypothetical protein